MKFTMIGGTIIGRATPEPVWRCSKAVLPIAKANNCEAPHFQCHAAGTMKVVMVDYGVSPEEGPAYRPKIIGGHILKIALIYAKINPLETNVCLVRFGRRDR
jgi:hypothetical protein